MPTQQRLVHRADQWCADALIDVGRELREARLSAGLSLRAVGRMVGRSHGRIAAIERDGSPRVSLALLARVAAVVGLRLYLRAYPGDRPVRDAVHSALAGRFRGHLHARLVWNGEVGVQRAGDIRSWDGAIVGTGVETRVELETRLHDGQALQRRIEAKRRDDPGIERVILVLADTRANRAALGALESTLGSDFPLRGREVLAALEEGRDPGGDGIVLL